MAVKLKSENFISKYRTSSRFFTRTRFFSFKSLFLFILYSIQSSIQRELDRFFKDYLNAEVSERFVSQSAFSQARLKIAPEAFQEINRYCIDFFYKNYHHKKWKGFRVVAIDGSEIVLPSTKETIASFGCFTSNIMNKSIVLARMSKAYDVLNKINIDASLSNRETGERVMAKKHLDYLVKGDLLILDRGYPSYELFEHILDRGIHFCARLQVSSWGVAQKLVESGQKEIVAEIIPSKQILIRYTQQGIKPEPIRCRFICVALPSGEKEVLITSLLDTVTYPCCLFKELYHLRWDIEESYKKDKHRLQLENFSGTSLQAIMQDFHANLLLGNLTSILTSDLEIKINTEKADRKYSYQINVTTALAKVREFIAYLFKRRKCKQLIEQLLEMLSLSILPIRPDRKYARYKHKRRRYHKQYLPL